MPTKLNSGLYRFCDVSKWQSDMDWEKAQTRLDFADAKMSQGIFRDPQWDANWTECQSLHFPLGAYHYFDTTSPWKAQANFFLNSLETYSVHPHIIPAIDLEMVRPVSRVADILNFLGDIIAALDVMPIIYT